MMELVPTIIFLIVCDIDIDYLASMILVLSASIMVNDFFTDSIDIQHCCVEATADGNL